MALSFHPPIPKKLGVSFYEALSVPPASRAFGTLTRLYHLPRRKFPMLSHHIGMNQRPADQIEETSDIFRKILNHRLCLLFLLSWPNSLN